MGRLAAMAIGIGFALAVGRGPARAGDDDGDSVATIAQAVADAEDARRAGDATTGDDADALYARCTQRYDELAAAVPRTVDRDVWLYTAALCAVRGHDRFDAMAHLRTLDAELPRSRFAPEALLRRAELELAVGEVELAIATWATLAARYPAEGEARDALANVVMLRAAVGDLDGAAAATDDFTRRFGAKVPAEAAQLAVGLAAERARRGDVDGAIAGYAAARTHTKLDRDELAVVIEAEAALRWARACPVALTVGLCLTPRGDAAHARRRADADLAQRGFAEVEQLVDTRDLRGAHALARAQLHRAERAIEAALAHGSVPQLPTDRDGRPTAAGLRRLSAWTAAWMRSTADAERAIAAVIDVGPGSGLVAVAIAARATAMYEGLAITLAAAPVPRPLRGTPGEAVYRDALSDPVSQLRERAVAAATVCLRRAADLSLVDPDLAFCAAYLASQGDLAYALDERRGAPAELAIDALLPAPPPPPSPPPFAP